MIAKDKKWKAMANIDCRNATSILKSTFRPKRLFVAGAIHITVNSA